MGRDAKSGKTPERGLCWPSISTLQWGPTRRPGRTFTVGDRFHFHRFPRRSGLTQPDTHGSFWRQTFTEPVAGPVALGFRCHFELGIFEAVE